MATIAKLDLARMEDAGEVVTTIEQVPVNDLNVDHHAGGYQRGVDQATVERIVRRFDPNLFEVLNVSMRDDGSYWVIDGHHRLVAARSLRLKTVTCRIIYGLDRQQEAELFTKFARQRRSITPYDEYKADLVSGNAVAHGVKQVLDQTGFCATYGSAYQPKTIEEALYPIRSVTSLRDAWKIDKGKTLARVLMLVSAAWGQIDPRSATKSGMIRGLSRTLSRYEEIDLDKLADALHQIAPSVITTSGEARAQAMNLRKPTGIAIIIVETYNKTIRNKDKKLPLDRLF